MKTSETVESLYQDYINAQIELTNLAKDSSGYGYKYTSLDKMIEATKPVLHKYGLAIIQMPIKDGLVSRLIHKSGEWIETVLEGEMIELAKMNKYQVQGSQLTYFRRYAWASICGIASDDDLDANTPKEQPQAKQDTPTAVLTDKQLKYINTLISQKGIDRDMLKTHYSVTSLKELSADTARKLIDWLNAQGVKE